MRFGYFDDQAREYVITRPDTPLPWINYLGCEDYFGIISNTAGGYSFYKDARLRRLTRYRYNNAPLDAGGRYIYLRDNDRSTEGKPCYWSPTWQPVQTPLDTYECRHGLGYTIIRSKLMDIEAQIRYFVPLGENLEIWELTLTNLRQTVAQLSIFPALEFCLWDALDDASNFQRNYSIGEVEVESSLSSISQTPAPSGMGKMEARSIIIHKSEYRERRDHFAYFASSEPFDSFETRRDAFLGTYGSWAAPLGVENGTLTNSIAAGWQPIAAGQAKIDLQPGENRKIIFILGYQENSKGEKFDPPDSQIVNKRRLQPILDRYLQTEQVAASFHSLCAYWQKLLETLQVTTPDEHSNRMVNLWNVYQVMTTFNLSRSASYFESGIGRGMGFRDSNQDLLGFVQLIPSRARQRILDLAATQLENGGAYHQYQPLTKRGNRDIGSDFNDDPLWLVLSVAAYIKESGDWSILAESVPYDNQPGSQETIYGHLERCIRYTLDRIGPHGLPLIGHADWNDCLNLNCFSDTPGQSFQVTSSKDGKVAESIFIAGLFVLAAGEMTEIARRWNISDQTHQSNSYSQKDYERFAKEMEATIWAAGWDGDWFRRAYDDSGNPIGSRECEEGQIYIEPQGICIMAGLGLENGDALKALDSVNARLATPHGILLHQPAYTRYYLNLGEISSYPPGYKENGGIFCHCNPWIIIAETRVGRGDQAFDYYLRINPSKREILSDVHRCEPYVYAQMIAGRDAPNHGEAKNSWLTGTASWSYVAITQWILGIRPSWDGLEIAPVIPAHWTGYTATRKFRGSTYHISVTRRGSGNMVSLLVDGIPIKGQIVPLQQIDNQEINIEVFLD